MGEGEGKEQDDEEQRLGRQEEMQEDRGDTSRKRSGGGRANYERNQNFLASEKRQT